MHACVCECVLVYDDKAENCKMAFRLCAFLF